MDNILEKEETIPEIKVLPRDLSAIHEVPVKISVMLGQAQMKVKNLLKIGRGAIIELDRRKDEPVDVLVNGRIVARGEIKILEDAKLAVSITEIVKNGS